MTIYTHKIICTYMYAYIISISVHMYVHVHIHTFIHVCMHKSMYAYMHISITTDLPTYVCDWLWENPPLMHKDKYWEIRNSIIQSVICQEGLKLQACNLLWIYSHLIALRLPTPQCTASWFFHHFYQHHKHLYRGGGWGYWVATKLWVTMKLSNFLGEME